MIKQSLAEQLSKLEKSDDSKKGKGTSLASEKKKEFSYSYITNHELLENAVINLLKFKEIAFDCEGFNLSRSGPLTVASFCGHGDDNDDESEIVYLVDVKMIGHSIVFPTSTKPSLKSILESKEVTKIMFDSRSDSDALFHQFKVKLENVLDLQVYDQGCRIAKGEKPPARRPGWFPFVKSMKVVMKDYIPSEILLALGPKGTAPHNQDQGVWNRRPLDDETLRYASNDIYIIKYMLSSMRNRKIPDDLMKAVIHHSNERVGAFRDSKKEIVWIKGSKNLIIMEEFPIVPLDYKLPSQLQSITSFAKETSSLMPKVSTFPTNQILLSTQTSFIPKRYDSDDYYDDYHFNNNNDDDDDQDSPKDFGACDSGCGYCGECWKDVQDC